MSAGINVTGAGHVETGSASLSGTVTGSTGSATSGSISVTAGTSGSGDISLTASPSLKTQNASYSGGSSNSATTVGGLVLSSADAINSSGGFLSVSFGSNSGASGGTNTPGALSVTTTNSDGNVYVQGITSMALGAISTAGTQTVDITTTNSGTITVVASSTTSANWTLNPVGGLAFSGAVTITAGTTAITVSNGGVTHGSASSDVTTTSGNLSIDAHSIGSSGSPFAVVVGSSGNLSLETTSSGSSGSIYVTSPSSLNLGVVTVTSGGTPVSVTTTGSTSDLDVVSSSTTAIGVKWILTSGENIAFTNSAELTLDFLTLNAAGTVTQTGSTSSAGVGLRLRWRPGDYRGWRGGNQFAIVRLRLP